MLMVVVVMMVIIVIMAVGVRDDVAVFINVGMAVRISAAAGGAHDQILPKD